MRIAMVAGEANPFCKSGGLADVILPLSLEYVKSGHDVFVLVPFYKLIKDRKLARFCRVGQLDVHMSWRHEQADVFFSRYEGINYFFIGSISYFDRERMYGYDDDGERFAFFQLAALAWLNQVEGGVDVIHVHDHQAAMIPALLKEKKADYPNLAMAKTVLTIHNPAFKGYLNPDALPELYELPRWLYDGGQVRFEGMVSTLKAGIIYSDKITTVSPNHAKELLTPEGSMGLSGVLKLRERDFVGIVNGIDEEEWNPATDYFLIKNYDRASFREGKAASREKVVTLFGLSDKGGPSFGLVSRLTSQKGVDILLPVVEKILADGNLLFLCGSGDPVYEERLRALQERFPKQFGLYVGFNSQLAHDIYAGSDFFLMPSQFEPCGIGQLIAKRYGALPIARATGGLKDTIISFDGKNGAEADGFLFEDYDVQGFEWAVKSAKAAYSNKKIFAKLVANAMEADHSWTHSGQQYLDLYLSLMD